MFHEIEDIQHELARLSRRPSPVDAPPVLCAFDVRTSTPVPDFEARMRSILAPALQLAVVHPYDGSDLPVDTLPDWFVAAARGPRRQFRSLYLMEPSAMPLHWTRGRGTCRNGCTSSTPNPNPAVGRGGT